MSTQSDKLTAMQYSLALLIGQDLDLQRMLRKFLPAALRLLQCSAGYIWIDFKNNDAEPYFYSYPRCDAIEDVFSAEAVSTLSEITDNHMCLYHPLIVKNDDYFLHFLPLGTQGVIVLNRAEKLSQQQILALRPILNRLETACHACYQHERVLEYQRELIEAKDAAEAGNKAKSEFMAVISHEIRTPMNAIMGLADLLAFSHLDDEQRGHVELVKESSSKLLEIINQILDLSKIETGALTLELAAFDLHETLNSCFKLFAASAKDKQLLFEYEIDANVPRFVKSDPTRFRQVVINLIANAVKFTEKGGVSVTVSVFNQKLCVCVEDSGIGISGEQIDLIVKPFQQADFSITRKYGGVGLGLSISSQLVNLMGGTMKLHSEIDVGSCFTVEIPYQDSAPISPKERAISHIEKSKASLKILLVEDNPVNRIVAETMLKKAGHNIVVAENGEIAVDVWRSVLPDLILMDVQMPVMDGIQATQLIREGEQKEEHVVIIALTANAAESDKTACIEAGMDGFISKPFDAQHLLNAITKLGH